MILLIITIKNSLHFYNLNINFSIYLLKIYIFQYLKSEFHSVKPDMHLGMERKPLISYNPNCKRNLLPVEECKMPANNASNIIIGDRT